jgi:hypothetical protein
MDVPSTEVWHFLGAVTCLSSLVADVGFQFMIFVTENSVCIYVYIQSVWRVRGLGCGVTLLRVNTRSLIWVSNLLPSSPSPPLDGVDPFRRV